MGMGMMIMVRSNVRETLFMHLGLCVSAQGTMGVFASKPFCATEQINEKADAVLRRIRWRELEKRAILE